MSNGYLFYFPKDIGVYMSLCDQVKYFLSIEIEKKLIFTLLIFSKDECS